MKNTAHCYEITGVSRHATPDAIASAHHSWLGTFKPLLSEELDREINNHARYARRQALERVDEAFAVLLKTAHPQKRRQRKRSRAH
ncbi:MAG: hypothetical protein P4M15_02850 [Alphaproteobacteria bacterium]|nr:hypothetical protein [Alphaproteobacteria bacterium]